MFGKRGYAEVGVAVEFNRGVDFNRGVTLYFILFIERCVRISRMFTPNIN